MRVIGIDPGSRLLGWGVVESAGNRFTHIDSGVVRAPVGAPLATRLLHLADVIDAMLARHRPEAVAVESVFFAKNSRAALILGHARGAVMLCAARSGAAIFEYAPSEIKQAVTGRGGADKAQVQMMVALLLGLRTGFETMDHSDALAVALCHLQVQASTLTAVLRGVG